jgi:gluconokinase
MVIVLMGVTGAGKTTVGESLAASLEWPLHDADDYHPPENKRKMRDGVPLTDEDRWPWLRALRAVIEDTIARDAGAVVTCSALKASYREVLAGGLEGVEFVLLHGSRAVLANRLGDRRGHFMNPGLLDSQLDTLEMPTDALCVDIEQTTEAQVRQIRTALGI